MAQAGTPAADEPAEERGPSQAAGGAVEEIVVRGGASELMEDFQTADSVAAFSAADLVALGAASIADLATFTPNLEIVTSGSTTPTFFIRGVGLNDFGANATSAVAIYQDDVPFNAQALQLPNLYDVETVNILRGPQGTGLARNSSAGAIKQYSRKPTGQFNGYLRGQAGNFNAREYEGAIEAPIFEDVLAGRLAFFTTKRDGTMRNRCGSATPADLQHRAIQPGFQEMTNQHKIATSAPWSICGEPVEDVTDAQGNRIGISEIPAGLPDWMNDRNNWAARGTLLFEPTLDTTFMLNAHGARRNELSRVGQSYGTTNVQWCLNDNFADCRTFYPAGSLINNALGGTQFLGGHYQAPEVKERLTELAPCYQLGFSRCTSQVNNPKFQQLSRAVQKVARELARDLDDEPWEGDFNHAGKTTNDTVGTYLKSEITLPYELTLTGISAFDRYYRKIDVDLDFSPETLFHILTQDDGYQFYQDLKLAGDNEIADTPFRWDVGGWVLPEKLDVKVHNTLQTAAQFAGVGDRFYDQRLLSMGGYGSFDTDLSDNFTLDGGVRWNWERKDIQYLLIEGIQKLRTPLHEHDVWRAPTGTIRLTYHFTEESSVYWKYNRGWKPGHYNATGSSFTGITTAKPEKIDAFETGLRSQWFGGMLGAEASLFYYNYEDYQIFTTQQLADATPEFVVINANNAEVYGAEINARLTPPWQGGYVNVNFGWLETEFLDFVTTLQVRERPANRFPFIAGREIQNSGNPVLNSPRFKVAITVEQAFPLGKYGYLIPRYDGAWSDTTYYDPTKGKGVPNAENDIQYLPKDTIAQRAYWLHNARVGYRTPDGRLEIAGWVRNIENKAYKNYAFDASSFFQTTIHFIGDPRTYGGTVTVTF